MPVTTDGDFLAGKPVKLFNANLSTAGFGIRRYAVSPDGQRFLYNTPVLTAGGAEFVVVTNWSAEFEEQ